jgi:ABC-type uncharacterized transport system fused permease/ATPase subunit
LGAIIGYAAFGTVMRTILGRTLVGLNFAKLLVREADFRYSLVMRLRENAESIAFYAGEDLEGRSISTLSLDMVAEARMYGLLQNMSRKNRAAGKISSPGLTYISVGHRPRLLAYHDKHLRLGGNEKHELNDIKKTPTEIKSVISNMYKSAKP